MAPGSGAVRRSGKLAPTRLRWHSRIREKASRLKRGQTVVRVDGTIQDCRLGSEDRMTKSVAFVLSASLALAGCAREHATRMAPPENNLAYGSIHFSGPAPAAASNVTAAALSPIAPERPIRPPKLQQLDLVGRWGYGSFLRDEDRDRTVAAAEKSCSNPYLIGQGPNGGVIMHLADKAEPVELAIRGSDDGHDYIGPDGPPGGQKDRMVESFDGHVLVLRWVSKEITGRYGTSVFVRCDQVPASADVDDEPRLSRTHARG